MLLQIIKNISSDTQTLTCITRLRLLIHKPDLQFWELRHHIYLNMLFISSSTVKETRSNSSNYVKRMIKRLIEFKLTTSRVKHTALSGIFI